MLEQIITFMEHKHYSAQSIEELAQHFNVSVETIKPFLDILEANYKIKQTKKRKYNLLRRFNLYVGTIEIKDKGFGFIRSDDFHDELFVPKLFTAGSMNQDVVLFSVTENNVLPGEKKEAAVVEIIKRNLQSVIGKINLNANKEKVFIPDSKRIDLVFEVRDFGLAVVGDVVEFCIDQYAHGGLVVGHIGHIIGNINDVGIDIKAIAHKYGFEDAFSEDIFNEIKTIEIDFDVEAKRRTIVDKTIITIDGADAKDLDDAISVQKLPNGHYELGVYIADVSYYVTEGSALNEEALSRGTSVYLADRIIPMLPHKLSNDWCSLNENEPKLIIACVMEIDETGKVLTQDIFEGIIKTKHRMTYDDVNEILENKDPILISAYQDIYQDLLLMEELAGKIRILRHLRGSLDFDIPEAKIVVDEQGKPIDVVLRKRGVGEKLIEEFMIIANETVAEAITHMGLPFIYRIHDEPNALKLQKFQVVAKAAGHQLMLRKQKVQHHALQKCLEELKGSDQGLATLLLRMMAKAKYSEKNIGHYGLASTCYTHFTSPIRRYPDLLVHRLLRKYLFKSEVSISDQQQSLSLIAAIAEQSSKRERDAIDCEYEVSDMKKAEFMENHIGEVFNATITSITNFGMFVSLPNTIEGLIHISDLEGFFVYDETKMMLVGRGKQYRLGDSVRVVVKDASKEKRQIDFSIIRSNQNGKQYKNNRKKQKGKS